MKKFFEKHDLFKMVLIMILIATVFSWILVYSYYQTGSLITNPGDGKFLVKTIFDSSTIGVYDLNTYALLGLYYFTNMFVFLLVVFGFYKILNGIDAYQVLTDKIAKAFSSKKKLFVAINILVYAILSSLFSNAYILIAFVPFTISIAKKLHLDKITSLIATFGGILLGILASTYSTGVAGVLADSQTGIGLKYGYENTTILIVGIVGYIILLALTFTRMNKSDSKDVSYEEVKDIFATDSDDKKKKRHHANIVPMAICLCAIVILFVLGYISWSTAFGITTFDTFHTNFQNATLFGQTLPSVLFGSTALPAFGTWDLFTGASTLILFIFIIKLIYRVKFDDIISNFISGLKISIKSLLLISLIYTVLVLTVSYPTIPGIVNQIDLTLGSVSALRPIAWVLNGIITSAFGVDFTYVITLIGNLYATYPSLNAAGLALQGAYGLASFFVPTSAILMLGLSMLNIKYKDYFKFIWKFLVAMLIVVLVVIYIVLYI